MGKQQTHLDKLERGSLLAATKAQGSRALGPQAQVGGPRPASPAFLQCAAQPGRRAGLVLPMPEPHAWFSWLSARLPGRGKLPQGRLQTLTTEAPSLHPGTLVWPWVEVMQ